MIIVVAYSCIVYHFYEVWWLLSYKQWSSLCKPLQMLFYECKGNNSAISQYLWDTQFYHIFQNSSCIYLTRNNH